MKFVCKSTPLKTEYMFRYTIAFLLLLTPLSFCHAQERGSLGRSLVSKYLECNDVEDKKEILETLNGLSATFDEVKEWIRAAADYKPQQYGLHRKLAPFGESHCEYFVYVPSSYVPDRAWPVVLALHGVGGRGSGQAMAWLKSSAHNDEFIFVAPTYGSGLWWEEAAERLVLSVLNTVKQDYHIDTNKVYLTGFSSGGHGVWYFAIRYPWLFAAINPIAGECPHPSLLANLMHVPACIVHGAKDTVIPVEAAIDAYSRLEKLNYRVIYKELPELRHRFPSSETEVVLDWFRINKRQPYPKRITFATESTQYSMSYWIEITEFSEWVGQITGVSRDMRGRLAKPQTFPETATVRADVVEEKNEIHLGTDGIKALRLYLDNGLVNLDKPLNVYINGKAVFSSKVDIRIQTILETARKRNERDVLFSTYIDVKVPTE